MIIASAMQNHNKISQSRISVRASIRVCMLLSASNQLLPCRPYNSCAKACVPNDCMGNACLCSSQDECVNGRGVAWVSHMNSQAHLGYPAQTVGRTLGILRKRSDAPWVSRSNGQAHVGYPAQTVGRTLGIPLERSDTPWASCAHSQTQLCYLARVQMHRGVSKQSAAQAHPNAVMCAAL